ncbi:MAG: hypothetical protein J6Q22_10435 [Prevotella sp.]|nr:hypothetical protein [Prevotella sp.]
MQETNFYSYLYAQSGVVAFDELVEVVELWNPDSIQRAFSSYIEDYPPPFGIKDELMEEKFYRSPDEGRNGDETYIRYDMSIPGLEGEVNADELQSYLEDFLDKIGAENNSENGYGVEVDVANNERGGADVDIYLYLKGKQIVEHKN